MIKRHICVASVGLVLQQVRADRYEAYESGAAYYEPENTPSTITASALLYKSLSFIISWLVAISFLRMMVIVVGKIVLCSNECLTRLQERMYPSSTDGSRHRRARGIRRRPSGGSLFSLGSVRPFLYLFVFTIYWLLKVDNFLYFSILFQL